MRHSAVIRSTPCKTGVFRAESPIRLRNGLHFGQVQAPPSSGSLEVMPGGAGEFEVICVAGHRCRSSLRRKLPPVAEVDQPGFGSGRGWEGAAHSAPARVLVGHHQISSVANSLRGECYSAGQSVGGSGSGLWKQAYEAAGHAKPAAGQSGCRRVSVEVVGEVDHHNEFVENAGGTFNPERRSGYGTTGQLAW